jgi:hypothetical protein
MAVSLSVFHHQDGSGGSQIDIDCPMQAGVRGLVIFHAYHKEMTRDK